MRRLMVTLLFATALLSATAHRAEGQNAFAGVWRAGNVHEELEPSLRRVTDTDVEADPQENFSPLQYSRK